MASRTDPTTVREHPEVEGRVDQPPTARPGHVEVWAPRAERSVALVTREGARHELTKTEGGWWAVDNQSLAAGTRYMLAVDGGEPCPDPRSLSQPDGVNGWSEIIDHEAFQWTDTNWEGQPLREAVIYELHVGTFTNEGTLDSAIDRLDYLADLGVNTIELMPVNAFNGDVGWGYDGVAWYAVHPNYGGPDAMKRFVNAAHERGLAVIVDVVYNHVGKRGDHLPAFGPYHHESPTPWGPRPRFDGPQSEATRDLVLDNVVSWIRDFHLDGIRADSVHSISDASSVHILESINRVARSLESHLGRRVLSTAETDYNTDAVL
jgi:maltooligosyltrehalose trehalohydrolase